MRVFDEDSVLVDLIRRRVLWRLIWDYTVCKCPICGTLGIDGLLCYFQRFWLKGNAHAIPARRRNTLAKRSKKTQEDSIRMQNMTKRLNHDIRTLRLTECTC